MSSIWRVEGRWPLRATPRTDVIGPTGWNGFFPPNENPLNDIPFDEGEDEDEDQYEDEGECGDEGEDSDTDCDELTEIYTATNYTPKPGGECKRITRIELSGTNSITTPPHGVTFIFVQGKEAACIVTRDLGEDKKIHCLQMDLFCMADPRVGKGAIIGHVFEQPAELYPYAVVSALLNSDDLDEEKESKPSSHKESSSRPLNEEAAINFLKEKLEDDCFKETIQTAISALQRLYQENVRADEIVVYTVHVDNSHKFLSKGEIEMHLASSST